MKIIYNINIKMDKDTTAFDTQLEMIDKQWSDSQNKDADQMVRIKDLDRGGVCMSQV